MSPGRAGGTTTLHHTSTSRQEHQPAVSKPKVYCINWSHDDAPHAGVMVVGRDGVARDAFFPTWAQALDFANRYAHAAAAAAHEVTA